MRVGLVVAVPLLVVVVSACGGAGGGVGGGAGGGVGGGAGGSLVTFTYRPQWTGVTAVSVIGGFGQTTDWQQGNPFITLINDGAGGFTATATLPAGSYPYLFVVTGDADATNTAMKRLAVDPTNPTVAICPSGSPAFVQNDKNPCSQLAVPQVPATERNVTGKVLLDGNVAAGYVVEIERWETGQHHFFVNRVTTPATGRYSLSVAAGAYRVQVQHPTILTLSDEQRDPFTLQALKRLISTQFTVAGAAVSLGMVETSDHAYGQMSPRDGGVSSLPISFGYTLLPGATLAQAAVYGTGNDGGSPNIGDPWFVSPNNTNTQAFWDGGFTTAKADEPVARPGERYFWGTMHDLPSDAGIVWSGQSMVLPFRVQ